MPVGGEDLDHYVGPPRLVVAEGDEPFDTVADGEPVRHVADAGEIVWRDDLGVTCRRWNWRQCTRTRLTTTTTNALFILDGLGSTGADELRAAAADLEHRLAESSPARDLRRPGCSLAERPSDAASPEQRDQGDHAARRCWCPCGGRACRWSCRGRPGARRR